jgi:RES domain-containing protein
MILYRIAKKKWAKDLSGIGAKLSGGRWNHKGMPMLYTSVNSSLAILEKLVHIDIDLLPNDLYITELEVPSNSIQKIAIKALPKNWNNYPSPDILKEIGKKWIEEGKYLTLEVPSAVNPNEMNYLLNIDHTLFKKVKIVKSYLFKVDDRFNR